MRQAIFNVKNEELILKEISKLRPLNYNRFMWWRRFDQKKRPLDNKSSLLDKIKNGDLEFSHYYWQALYTEMEMNEKYIECIDEQHFTEQSRVDKERRRRLWGDFEKDEAEKLSTIKKQFPKEFRMTKEDYDDEILEFGGTLLQLYHHCEIKYGKKLKIQSKRGRPKKYE
tara:strand:+ start:87 stop:596 length:510 start_codon:yes stop_codon:yes gene_type:complete